MRRAIGKQGRGSKMKRRTYALLVLGGTSFTLPVAGSAVGATAVAPVNVTPPAISGTPQVGQTLTASNGTWTTSSPANYAYQWLRCNGGGNSCANVANGTQQTYTLVGADAGKTMRVRVTATNADGSAAAESAQTATVAAATASAAPKNTSAPTISGTPKVGQELTANPGSWSSNPSSYAYQWQRCNVDVVLCSDVTGATGTTYGVRSGDLGYRLRVVVTARNAKGSATASSTPTTVVAPTTPPNGRPTISILRVEFVGASVYLRMRICDDSQKNLTIIETDSRPGRLSNTRRFATLVPPRPCGVYTRHWRQLSRFRGTGKYTITVRARDTSGSTSFPARRTFTHG